MTDTTLVGGPVFTVNAANSLGSIDPVVANLGNGNFAVAYVDNVDIKFATFNAAGQSVIAPTTISSLGGGHLALAVLTNNQIAVTWSDGADSSIDGQLVDFSSNKIGSAFNLATGFNTDGGAAQSSVTALANGGFAVSYEQYNAPDSFDNKYDVVTQRFNADGSANGSSYLMESSVFSYQAHPSEATLTNGNFVTVWEDHRDNPVAIRAAVSDASGATVVADFVAGVDHALPNPQAQINPTVTALADGDFVVTWTGQGGSADNDSNGILARVFHSDGTALGGAQTVNSTKGGAQSFPTIASLDDGGFVIVWESADVHGPTPYISIRGQQFDATGTAVGSEFLVTTVTGSSTTVKFPAVAGISGGGFVVSWDDAVNNSVDARIYSSPSSDTTAPTVSITDNSSGHLKAGQTDTITFTFSEAVSGFGNGAVTVNGGTLGTITATSDPTKYTASFTPDVTDSLSASIKVNGSGYADLAHNAGTDSASFGITGDTKAPAVNVQVTSNANLVVGLSGTGDANASVSVDTGDGIAPTIVNTDATGHWSVQHTYTVNGTYAVTVSESDATGNIGSATTSVNAAAAIDTTAPTVTISDSASGHLKAGQADAITFTFSEAVTGFGNASVNVSGGTLGSITATSDPTKYTATFTPDVTDSLSASIKVNGSGYTDLAHNAGTDSASFGVTGDTKAPAPTVGVTSNTNRVVALGGSGDANAAVSLDFGDGTTNSALTDGTGHWTTQHTYSQDGSFSVKVSESDAAQNSGSATTSLNVAATTDTTAPTVTISDDALGHLKAGQTDTMTFTFSEAVTGFDKADVTVTGGVLGTVSATSDPTIYTATFTPDVTNTLAATITVKGGGYSDLSSNAGTASSAFHIQGDTKAPSAPTNLADPSFINGYVNKAHDTAAQTMTGKAEAGSVVSVYDGLTKLGTALVGNNGQWSFVLGTLSEGVHILTATAKDSTGNISDASAPLAVLVNTTPPPAPTLWLVKDTGSSGTDLITSNDAIKGTANPGGLVTISDGALSLHVIADSAGNWSYQPSHLGDGLHHFTVSQTDAAGNASATTTLTFTLDTKAPDVGISLPSSSFAPRGVDGTINVSGTGEAGTKVQVYEGNSALGTPVTVDGSGHWTAAVTPGSGVYHAFTAMATDVAGNSRISFPSYIKTDNFIAAAHNQAVVNDSYANDLISIDGSKAGVFAGSGDDTIVLKPGATGAVQHIDGGPGSDIFDFSLLSAGVNVDLSKPVATATGSQINTLQLTSIENVIGSAGADHIIGDGNNNHINGKGGDDFLTGGGGIDTFIFNSGFGRDTIADFHASGNFHDIVQLDHALFASWSVVDAHLSNSALGAVLTLDANDTITFTAVTKAQLELNHATDFIFV